MDILEVNIERPCLGITPRVAEFCTDEPDIKELLNFLSLDSVKMPVRSRPYIWASLVSTADGVISYHEDPNHKGPQDIALGHIPLSGSTADHRVLNFSWANADAILTSGSTLRNEGGNLLTPWHADIVKYRTAVLGKSRNPTQVILTGSGEVDPEWKIFADPEAPCVVFTHPYSLQALVERFEKKLGSSQKNDSQKGGAGAGLNAVAYKMGHVTVVSFAANDSEQEPYVSDGKTFSGKFSRHVPIALALEYLHTLSSIRFMDASAGGNVFAQLLREGLIDEWRMTQSGQLCGLYNSAGICRPTVHPTQPGQSYVMEDHPLLVYEAVRLTPSGLLMIVRQRFVHRYRKTIK